MRRDPPGLGCFFGPKWGRAGARGQVWAGEACPRRGFVRAREKISFFHFSFLSFCARAKNLGVPATGFGKNGPNLVNLPLETTFLGKNAWVRGSGAGLDG